MIKSYEGELGKFDYDDEWFELDRWADSDVLKYIGNEFEDHEEIEKHLPVGITSMFRMFAGNEDLKVCIDMPDTIITAEMAYLGCTGITKTNEKWSKNIENIESMFEGCSSLVDVYKMSPSIKYANSAFKDCISMQKCMITLPASLIDASQMYEGCISLTQSPKILMGCKNCRRMFANCVKLKTAPQLHKETDDVTEMYLNARNLVAVPSIPHDARMKIFGIAELRPNVSEYPTKGKNKARKEAKKKAFKAKKAQAARARRAAKEERRAAYEAAMRKSH